MISMKLGFLLTTFILSSSVFASDFLRPMFNPDKGEFLGSTQVVLGSRSYDQRNEDLNDVDGYTVTTQSVVQRAQLGMSKSLVLLGDLEYTIGEKIEYDSVETNASGIKKVNIGARYRINDLMDLPMTLDAGAMFAPSLSNKSRATADDDGSTNYGGHVIKFFARTGSDSWYVKLDYDLYLEQTVEDSGSGDELYTVSSFSDITINPGLQFDLGKSFLIDVSGLMILRGEQEQDNQGGGSATYESTVDLGGNAQFYYNFSKSLSFNFGFQYLFNQERALDAANKYTIRDDSVMDINIGAVYFF
jgi:hypothetical protein